MLVLVLLTMLVIVFVSVVTPPPTPCRAYPLRQYNPIFEFEGCGMMGQSVDMKITSVTGHLMELEFAEPFGKKWGACQPVELFTAPLIRYVKEVRRCEEGGGGKGGGGGGGRAEFFNTLR